MLLDQEIASAIQLLIIGLENDSGTEFLKCNLSSFSLGKTSSLSCSKNFVIKWTQKDVFNFVSPVLQLNLAFLILIFPLIFLSYLHFKICNTGIFFIYLFNTFASTGIGLYSSVRDCSPLFNDLLLYSWDCSITLHNKICYVCVQ